MLLQQHYDKMLYTILKNALFSQKLYLFKHILLRTRFSLVCYAIFFLLRFRSSPSFLVVHSFSLEVFTLNWYSGVLWLRKKKKMLCYSTDASKWKRFKQTSHWNFVRSQQNVLEQVKVSQRLMCLIHVQFSSAFSSLHSTNRSCYTLTSSVCIVKQISCRCCWNIIESDCKCKRKRWERKRKTVSTYNQASHQSCEKQTQCESCDFWLAPCK